MGCNHLLQAWRSRAGPDKKSGSWPLVFDIKKGIPKKEVWVPCGRCIACRLERSRQWAARCMAEASLHTFNCFITLTYNYESAEKRLKMKSEVTGEDIYSLRVEKDKKGRWIDDFQLFMKRLRKDLWKNEKIKIRFFHCGEYGERFERPHHHACIFGYWPIDAKPWRGKSDSQLYTSNILSSIWGFGNVYFGEVTFESAAYVARYVTKKINGEMQESWYEGRFPEYVSASLRPGIGADWYRQYKGDLSQDSMMIRPGIFARPPKFFDKLLEKEDKNELIKRKDERMKKALENKRARNERLKDENVLKYKFKNKKRSFENG